MTFANRAIIAIAVVAGGWALMGIAYDRPEWYFQVVGVIGFLFVVCAIVLWFVAARRAKT